MWPYEPLYRLAPLYFSLVGPLVSDLGGTPLIGNISISLIDNARTVNRAVITT